MKIVLILYLCSYTAGSCLPGYQVTDKFDDMFDCMNAGYNKSIEKMEEIGREEANEHEAFVRFACVIEEDTAT